MKVSVTHLSPTEVKLNITLEAAELADGKTVALARLARTLKVPGFRKGKVPASVAAKHVNQIELAEATLDAAVSKAIAESFTSEKLRALERPRVEIAKYVPDEMAEFTAEAEVVPEIKLGDYRKLKLKKRDAITVTQPQIDEIVNRIREQLGTSEVVERAAKMGDEVMLDFVGKKDGVAFDGGTASDYMLVLGSGTFIPGFEEGLVGHKAGDEVSIPLVFPSDYRVADLAGADVVFETVVKEVREKKPAELNDELAAKAGPYTTAQELVDDVTNELKAKAERDRTADIRDEVVELLVEKSKIPVPKVLVEDQIASIEQDLQQNLMYQGMTFEQYLTANGFADRDAWVASDATKLAEQRVKAGLALSEVSQVEDVTVSNDEMMAEVAAYKEHYAKNPEMAARFDTEDVQRNLANRLVTEKTIDFLVDTNTKK